jgi:hypothetical protein
LPRPTSEDQLKKDTMGRKSGQDAVNIDGNLRNAGWTKRSIDAELSTVEGLRETLAMSDWTVERFKNLPVYQMDNEFFDKLIAQL